MAEPVERITPKPPVAGVRDPEVKPELLAAYRRLLAFQFTGALVLVGILAAGLLLSYFIAEKWDIPILVLVALSGMLGAFFSALTRLYNVDQLSVALITPTVRALQGPYLLMYSLVPPIIGAVGAVVMYVIFVAGLIEGGLFPKLTCKHATDCNDLVRVLNDYRPEGPRDYGKALIWAFIAGFSERLVPDTLTSLVAKSRKDDKDK